MSTLVFIRTSIPTCEQGGLTEGQQLGDGGVLLAAVQRRAVGPPEAWGLEGGESTEGTMEITEELISIKY
jgi:hypothetical protein